MGDSTKAAIRQRLLWRARFLFGWCGAMACACAYPRLEMNETSATTGGNAPTFASAGRGGDTTRAAGASAIGGSQARGGSGNGGTTSGTSGTFAAEGGHESAGQPNTGTVAVWGGASSNGGASTSAGAPAGGISQATSVGGAAAAAGTPQVTGGASTTTTSGGTTSSTSTAGTTTNGGARPTAGAPTAGGVPSVAGTGAAAGSLQSFGGSSTGGTVTDTKPYGIALGFQHACAIQKPGTIQCWGENDQLALGYPTTSVCNGWDCSTTPNPVPDMSSALAVVAGVDHTCAIVSGADSSNQVQCWGYNKFGQLGNGTSTDAGILPPVAVQGISSAQVIAAGARNSCVIQKDGNVQCWGDNSYGQLGDGTTATGSASPVTVKGINGTASDIACGTFHACAVLGGNGSGPVMCWGRNDSGQLGISRSTAYSNTPVAVAGIDNAVVVTAGQSHSCALLEDNSVKCWGANGVGQLGNGTTQDSYQPVLANTNADFGDGVVAFSAGIDMTCAVFAFGSIKCWGIRMIGNFSSTFSNTHSTTPAPISGVSDVYNVSCGAWGCCALLNSRRIQCWGDNSCGELGTGNTDVYKDPAYVSGY